MTVIIHVWEPKKGNSLRNLLNWSFNHIIQKINKGFELPTNVGHTSISIKQPNGDYYYSSHTAARFFKAEANQKYLGPSNYADYEKYFEKEYNLRNDKLDSKYSEFVIENLNENNIIKFLEDPKIETSFDSFDFSRYSIVENCCLYTLHCLKKGLECTKKCNLCSSPGNRIYGKGSIIRLFYQISYLILVSLMIYGVMWVISKIFGWYPPNMTSLVEYLNKIYTILPDGFTSSDVILGNMLKTLKGMPTNPSIFEIIAYFTKVILNNILLVLWAMWYCSIAIQKMDKFKNNPDKMDSVSAATVLAGFSMLLTLFLALLLLIFPYIPSLFMLIIFIYFSYILLGPFRIWTPIDVVIFIESIVHKFDKKIDIKKHRGSWGNFTNE